MFQDSSTCSEHAVGSLKPTCTCFPNAVDCLVAIRLVGMIHLRREIGPSEVLRWGKWFIVSSWLISDFASG